MNIKKMRALQYIRRFNYESCLHYQSVAEHSLMCALIAYDLCDKYGYEQKMVLNVMLHDIAESVTGDIPHLIKAFIKKEEIDNLEAAAYKELDINNPEALYEDIIRYVDILELCLYLQEERCLGNTNLLDIEAESRGRLRNYPVWNQYTWTLLDNKHEWPM